MNKILFTLFLFISIPFFALYSQNNSVIEIDKYVDKLNSDIASENGGYGNYFTHKINFESIVRAIGRQNTEVKFYYTQPEEEALEGGNHLEFKLKYLPPPKITVNYNIAASQDVAIEYYYRKGNLVLYHCISKGAYYCVEEKYYFENEKLIKIKVTSLAECKDKETLETRTPFERTDNFSKTDLKVSGKYMRNSVEYKKIFYNLVELEKLDK